MSFTVNPKAHPAPNTLEEVIAQIRLVFPEPSLTEWAALPEEIALTRAHWDLGLWLRNTWIYTHAPIARDIEAQWPSIDADAASGLVVQALWRTLNGQPCPSIADLRPAFYFNWKRPKLQWD